MSARTPVEGQPQPDELDDELDDGPDDESDDELHDEMGIELADDLEVESEVEAAERAPLVELPDQESFGPPSAEDDVLTVRVRGEGRVPARKVRRVIRRIDPLSVLKLSFAFSLCLFAMFLIAALLLWSAAVGSGSLDNIESFVIDIGFEDFHIVGNDLFRGFLAFGSALVVVGTVFSVLLALLFNLISDLVGGIRFTVIEPLAPVADAPAEAEV